MASSRAIPVKHYIVIDISIPGGRVVRTLDRLVDWRDTPTAIRVENGSKYLSAVFADWCRERCVELRYIQPGKPNQTLISNA